MMILNFDFGFRSLKVTGISLFILLFSPQDIFAQHAIPLNGNDNRNSDYYSNNLDIHSSVQPALDVDLNGKSFKILDSTIEIPSGDKKLRHSYFSSYQLNYPRETFRNYYKKPSDTTAKALGGEAAFLVRPIYDFTVGGDLTGKKAIYSAVAGAIIDADYKHKIGIELRVAGGNATLPNYLDSIARKSGTMPGWGDRAYANGNGNYSFQHLSGNIVWRPSKIFNLQIGRDKHFWGDGYRSLFLSDAGAPMPYMKMTTTIWKLQYTSLFMMMQDWTNSNGSANDFRNKYGTFHYISFNATKWLNIGVFESIIWQGTDSHRMRGFDPNYLNPITFYRPVEYSLGSPDNAMLGFAFKIRLNAKNQIYGQLLLDEFYLKEILARNGWWANKQGYQLGYKSFNLHGISSLNSQLELNIVRPYTYSHGSPQQSYSDGGMPLGDPLGANFAEVIGILSYNWKQFTFRAEFICAEYGLDPAGKDFGQNIFVSYLNRSSTDPLHPLAVDYNHRLFDGLATDLFYGELKASYWLNTKFPLRAEFLVGARSENNTVMGTKSSFYLQAGMSLPLWKTYRDY